MQWCFVSETSYIRRYLVVHIPEGPIKMLQSRTPVVSWGHHG